MNYHPVPPPSYGAAGTTPGPKLNPNSSQQEEEEPFIGPSTTSAYYHQGVPGDVPDDFKYGVTVAESAVEIRLAFIRKVYSILFLQIVATSIIAAVVAKSPAVFAWVQKNPWSLYVPLFGSLFNIWFLYLKRHSHPWNFVLLGTFTAMEAFALGVTVGSLEDKVILQAFLITLGVFFGLTLFTLQSKWDFSGMGPFLFGALIALIMAGLVGIFIPFGKTANIFFAVFGCLLFSGYVVYDTYLITQKLSPDEYIAGVVSLYLDFVNLFIHIISLLYNLDDS